MQYGALPDFALLEAGRADWIGNLQSDCVNPASFDLTLGSEVYCIGDTCLPESGQSVLDMVRNLHPSPHSYNGVFECGTTYVVRARERLALAPVLYGYSNPKSTSGRVGLKVRTLADGVARYDSFPPGFSGGVWVAITPQYIPVRLYEGERLTQVRLFNRDTRFMETELAFAMDTDNIIRDERGAGVRYNQLPTTDRDGSVILGVDLSGDVCGWQCVAGRDYVLDFSRRDCAANSFFMPLRASGGRLRLEKGAFYLLQTLQRLCVPPKFACELRPNDERAGEFRSHFAGFIDPGFGYGHDGLGNGLPVVLEVFPYENLWIHHGQAMATFRFERMCALPCIHYDHPERGSHYTSASASLLTSRAPRLSKHFVMEC